MWVVCLFCFVFVELFVLVICFVGLFWLIVWLALGLCCLVGGFVILICTLLIWCVLCFVWWVV